MAATAANASSSFVSVVQSVIPSFVRLSLCAFVCCLAGFVVVAAVVALVSFWLWPNLEPQRSQFIGRVFTTNTVAS